MKSCWTLLVISKMQIRITRHYVSTKTANVQGLTVPVLVRNMRQLELLGIADGNVNCFEKPLSFILSPSNPTPWHIPERNEGHDHQKTCTGMFAAAFSGRLPGSHCRHYLRVWRCHTLRLGNSNPRYELQRKSWTRTRRTRAEVCLQQCYL